MGIADWTACRVAVVQGHMHGHAPGMPMRMCFQWHETCRIADGARHSQWQDRNQQVRFVQ
eukprot:357089-Chlamydomonas_euryale.AAC.5